MAIYRPPKRRWTVATATGLVGLLLGLLVGWGVLRPEPDPAEVLGDVRATLVSAASALEVVTVEYAESVEDGQVVAEPEYRGARDALASSRQTYEEVREAVTAISPDLTTAIDDAYDRLEAAVGSRAGEDEVETLAADLTELLEGGLGG